MELKAIHYGQVEIIPGIFCDAYVLNDDTCVMSERGTADLLNINQMALNRMKTSGLPKNLKAFTNNSLNVKTTNIIVEINNVCHEKKVSVYNTFVVMELGSVPIQKFSDKLQEII